MLLNTIRPYLATAIVLGLAACTPHQIYRPDLALCPNTEPEQNCLSSAVQEYRDADHPDAAYLLGFIEFDDQGQLWKRKQMDTVIKQIYAQSGEGDVLIIVFAHGWKHNAAHGDSNITNFRHILKRVSMLESRQAARAGTTPREVFGVYLGWRGASVTAPLLKELTFWDRKATAEKVGHGSVAEVLSRLELVKQTKTVLCRETGKCNPKTGESDTRLVIIGHSFGGALVHTAVAQLLENRFVLTRSASEGAIDIVRGFGDLVVLINPAFEANLYAPLSNVANERRTYFTGQRPILAILTSEADKATRVAFPLGRSLSTLFEIERTVERPNPVINRNETIDQGKGNVTTVGHFAPYRTHFLRPASAPVVRLEPSMPEEMAMLQNVKQGWDDDAAGSEIAFHGSVLTRTVNSAGRNPYLVIKVSKELIPNHNDIYDPRITAFLRGLIFLSVR